MHVDSVVSKDADKIGALKRAGYSLTQAARWLHYLSVIQSDLQYGMNVHWTTVIGRRRTHCRITSGLK